jgi:hypothetical protein
MSALPDWLPELMPLCDSNGDWQHYEDQVYAVFYTDFIESCPHFQNGPVRITKQLIDGKERTFWHCVQEGRIEAQRTPDLRRCERIPWIRATIENSNCFTVKKWQNKRGRNVR